MSTPDISLITAVRAGLASRADPNRAPRMRSYMKSELPYHGIPVPECRRLARALVVSFPQPTLSTLLATVSALWRGASHREERYVALEVIGARQHARWLTPELLPLYEEWVVTGAWWDLVDELAIRRIGPLLRTHPAELTVVLRRWAHDEDRWKRRTAVICQIGSKDATDTRLLTSCVEANLGDQDFFLRKGIGWALRQHARTDPDWVRAFVDGHPDLSPLSRREALKHLAT